MELLKADPANADLKQKTLELGRAYSRAARDGGKASLFDEMALGNDMTAATANATAAPSPAPQKVGVEERLANLTQLREKGLIDEAEYERKRSEILSDL